MTKTALITGITGQDGYYLSAFLLEKGYRVVGLVQPLAHDDTQFLAPLTDQLDLRVCDLCDGGTLTRVLADVRPDEIYNLGARSHVGHSFDVPEMTMNVNALGTLRLLEAIRALKMIEHVRFYQASTSEIFGDTLPPQSETSHFNPRSPYAIAKLSAHFMVKNYRKAYGLHASNGILFNHESPKRGEGFVTQKVARGVAAIDAGQQSIISLGNLNAERDWGHARDYVEGMWAMLQQDKADDYVLATGQSQSVRRLCEEMFKYIGVSLVWQGQGENERGIDANTGEVRIDVDPQFFRPLEVENLLGDARKARDVLGWHPKISFEDMVCEMVEEAKSCIA